MDKLRWHYQRIEDKFTPGIPDLNVHIPVMGDFWIELKYVDIRRVDAGRQVNVGLRREQFIWLRDAKLAGRNVYLVARAGMAWYVWDTIEAWKLAKDSIEWPLIRRLGLVFPSAVAVLWHLQGAKGILASGRDGASGRPSGTPGEELSEPLQHSSVLGTASLV